MSEIALEILNLLKEKKIPNKDITSTLIEINNSIEFLLWEKTTLSPSLFYNLKDTVWFNLEHLKSGGEEKGMSSLRFLGTKYPILMSSFNEDVYLEKDQIEDFTKELKDIMSRWSNDWLFVQLIAKTQEIWSYGSSDSSSIVIYEPNKESPIKYGYRPNSPKSLILDKDGNNIKNEQQETIHCCIETKLGTYGKEPLMRNLLERLIDCSNKAFLNSKGIMISFEQYDFF